MMLSCDMNLTDSNKCYLLSIAILMIKWYALINKSHIPWPLSLSPNCQQSPMTCCNHLDSIPRNSDARLNDPHSSQYTYYINQPRNNHQSQWQCFSLSHFDRWVIFCTCSYLRLTLETTTCLKICQLPRSLNQKRHRAVPIRRSPDRDHWPILALDQAEGRP